jgi:hypothetical protein
MPWRSRCRPRREPRAASFGLLCPCRAQSSHGVALAPGWRSPLRSSHDQQPPLHRLPSGASHGHLSAASAPAGAGVSRALGRRRGPDRRSGPDRRPCPDDDLDSAGAVLDGLPEDRAPANRCGRPPAPGATSGFFHGADADHSGPVACGGAVAAAGGEGVGAGPGSRALPLSAGECGQKGPRLSYGNLRAAGGGGVHRSAACGGRELGRCDGILPAAQQPAGGGGWPHLHVAQRILSTWLFLNPGCWLLAVGLGCFAGCWFAAADCRLAAAGLGCSRLVVVPPWRRRRLADGPCSATPGNPPVSVLLV